MCGLEGRGAVVCERRWRCHVGCTAAQAQAGDKADQRCLQGSRSSSTWKAGWGRWQGSQGSARREVQLCGRCGSTQVNGSSAACAWGIAAVDMTCAAAALGELRRVCICGATPSRARLLSPVLLALHASCAGNPGLCGTKPPNKGSI